MKIEINIPNLEYCINEDKKSCPLLYANIGDGLFDFYRACVLGFEVDESNFKRPQECIDKYGK